MQTTVIVAVAAVACGLIIMLLRNKRALGHLALNSAGGLAAFGVVNLTGMLTGVSLIPNLWTIAIAVLMGLPGVVCLLFLKIILVV